MEPLVKLAENGAASASPLAGLVIFGYFYLNTPATSPLAEWIIPLMGVSMCLCGICFMSRMLFGWPPIPPLEQGIEEKPAPPAEKKVTSKRGDKPAKR